MDTITQHRDSSGDSELHYSNILNAFPPYSIFCSLLSVPLLVHANVVGTAPYMYSNSHKSIPLFLKKDLLKEAPLSLLKTIHEVKNMEHGTFKNASRSGEMEIVAERRVFLGNSIHFLQFLSQCMDARPMALPRAPAIVGAIPSPSQVCLCTI